MSKTIENLRAALELAQEYLSELESSQEPAQEYLWHDPVEGVKSKPKRFLKGDNLVAAKKLIYENPRMSIAEVTRVWNDKVPREFQVSSGAMLNTAKGHNDHRIGEAFCPPHLRGNLFNPNERQT